MYKLVKLGQGKQGDLNDQIYNFFIKNPHPNDDAIHAFAEELGIDAHEFEGKIYGLLSDMIANAPGRHKDSPDSEFDPKELEMGIKVENEHTDSPALAKEIAKDHLTEIKDYYTRLRKMEEEAGVKD